MAQNKRKALHENESEDLKINAVFFFSSEKWWQLQYSCTNKEAYSVTGGFHKTVNKGCKYQAATCYLLIKCNTHFLPKIRPELPISAHHG